MADIGSLVVNIGANASGMLKTFDDLVGSGKQFQRGMESISKVISTAFFAATSAAVAMTIQAGKTAEETEQLAQKTGIAADSIEGMTVLMNRNGLTGQSMAAMMRGLAKEMVGVQQRTASSVKLFQDLGVSLDVVNQGTGATLRAVADRFKDMANGAEKARIAVELFGRAGLDWIPILNKGGAALDESIKKSAEFGLVLTDTARNDLTVFDDAMDDLQSAMKGFAMQVGVAFAPAATIVVKAFTDAIVFTKDTFNQLSDAGSVLTIRLAAMVASVQLLSGTLFSLQAFSKAAWQETIDHIKAIDGWAAAQIKGVAVAREAEKELAALAVTHLDAADAAKAHAAHQKILGEQIVSFTKNQLAQQEIEYKRFFEGVYTDAKSTADARLAIERAVYEQNRGIFSDVVAVRHAATKQILADLAMQQQVENKRYQESEITATQYQERLTNLEMQAQAKRMGVAAQFPTFWERQLQSLVASNTFSIAQITTTWTSGLANAIVNGGNFVKAAWQSTQVAIVQGALNTGVQLAAEWALRSSVEMGWMTKTFAARLLGLTTSEQAMTAVTTAQEAARVGIVLGGMTAMKAANAVAVASLTTTGLAAIGVMEAVLQGIVGFMLAVAAAVAAVPIVGQVLAGTLIVGATLAQVLGQAAIVAATVGLTAAAASAAATGTFQEGGIGNFGSGTAATLHGPEAIIPLNQRGAAFLQEAFGMGEKAGQIIHTHVYLKGREIAMAVSDDTPGALRTMGVL